MRGERPGYRLHAPGFLQGPSRAAVPFLRGPISSADLVWGRGGSERRLRGGGFVEGWGACVPPLGPTLKLQQGFFDVLWNNRAWSMATVSYYLLASTLRLSFLIKNLALWRSGDVSLPHFWL